MGGDDWGKSGFIFDRERTEVPGFQASIYWYRRWLPLVSLNLIWWGITIGWTDASGSGLATMPGETGRAT